MSGHGSSPWYDYVVIFEIRKTPYDKPDKRTYYKVDSELFNDMLNWMASQEDTMKL